jgi:hypothetical protein
MGVVGFNRDVVHLPTVHILFITLGNRGAITPLQRGDEAAEDAHLAG